MSGRHRGVAARSRVRSAAISALVAGAVVLATVGAPPPAEAASLLLGPGTYTVDTSTLQLTGPSTNVTGKNVDGIAVFTFGTIDIPDGATIVASGSRPLELVATDSLILSGIIDGSGASANRSIPGDVLGGPAGGSGGVRTDFTTATPGGGPGGGAAGGNGENGGAGGGFGGAGARGGVCQDLACAGGSPAAGGAAYGDLDTTLQGGSGGGPGWNDAPGGGGGGAIALVASSLTITPTGIVLANGGDGDSGGSGASGGGSGGAIVVHGDSVEIDGELRAQGGLGGTGSCCGDGGGGAGGRIAIQFKTYSTNNGTLSIRSPGGDSGARSTSGYPSGAPSPDPRGASGVITFAHIDASTLTIGRSRKVVRGSRQTIATKLVDRATGQAIAHQTVMLYRRTSPSGSWSRIATKTTSSTGAAHASVVLTRAAQFQWRYAGSWVHDPATSATQSIGIS